MPIGALAHFRVGSGCCFGGSTAAPNLIRKRFCVLGLLLTFWSCTDQSLEPEVPDDSVDVLTVSLDLHPDTVMPGQLAQLTAFAELPESGLLTTFELRISGLGADTVFSPQISQRGSHGISLDITVPTGPIEGRLRFDFVAGTVAETDSTHAFLTIIDDGPPTFDLTVPEAVEPPDAEVRISYAVADVAGVVGVRFQVSGALTLDTIFWHDLEPQASGELTLLFPAATRLGAALQLIATVRDGFLKEVVEVHSIRYADTTLPALDFAIDTIPQPELGQTVFPLTFVPGDTLRLAVTGSDNHKLGYLGYQWGVLGDSVAKHSPADSAEFELPITQEMDAFRADLSVFASDSSGNRSDLWTMAAVVHGATRSIATLDPFLLTLDEHDEDGGVVHDSKRDVLYVAYPHRTTVGVVALNPLAELEPIDLGGGYIRAVDMLPGGDSLIAAVMGDTNHLMIWDIADGTSSIDSIPFEFGLSCYLKSMQVAANRHALITADAWGNTRNCGILDVDLESRQLVVHPANEEWYSIERSGDRRTMMVWNGETGMLYWSDLDSLSAPKHLFPELPWMLSHLGPSMDRSGNVVLIRNRVYDAGLTTYRWLLPDPGNYPPSHALSADGRTAFIGNWPGYWKVDVATGEVSEKVILPWLPIRLWAHPDGERLVVLGPSQLGVVDLR